MSTFEAGKAGLPAPQEEVHPQCPNKLRQRQLGRLLGTQTAGRFNIVRQYQRGVIPLIPIHNDERIKTVGHTLKSLVTQGYDGTMQVVIADNGLSDSGGREIKEIADGLGLEVDFADAKPQHAQHKNPAYARNTGIKHIQEKGKQNPAYRSEAILLLDSDTALTAGSLQELEDTFRRHEDAVAVTAANKSVATLDPKEYMDLSSSSGRDREVLLPILFSNGSVDVSSIVAFGSDIAAKTTGVLIDRDVLERLGQPFVVFPNGSAEDMAFSAALNRYGRTYHNPNARLLDQARESAILTRQQRLKWGRDHAVLFNDLIAQDLVRQPGIRVLEPENSRWVEWFVPNTDHVMGVVVNPKQLRGIGNMLLNAIEQDGPQSYGADVGREKIIRGLQLVKEVTSMVAAAREGAYKVARVELPSPIQPDYTQTRFSSDALSGLLAGNIMGMHDIQEISEHGLPRTILFGVRQAASYNR